MLNTPHHNRSRTSPSPKRTSAILKYALTAVLRLILGTVQLALLLAALIALLSFLIVWIVLAYVNRLYERLGRSALSKHLQRILLLMFGTASGVSNRATSSSGSAPVVDTSDSYGKYDIN